MRFMMIGQRVFCMNQDFDPEMIADFALLIYQAIENDKNANSLTLNQKISGILGLIAIFCTNETNEELALLMDELSERVRQNQNKKISIH